MVSSAAKRTKQFRRGWPLCLPIVCVSCSPGVTTVSPPPIARIVQTDAPRALSLIVEPDPLSLGTLKRGESARGEMYLRNDGDQPIRVSRVETSCECVRVEPSSFVVEPKMSMLLSIVFDASAADDFRGGLDVVVKGRSEAGEERFRSAVRLSVLDEKGGDHAER